MAVTSTLVLIQLFLVSFIPLGGTTEGKEILVNTEFGAISGSEAENVYDTSTKYNVFYGVPYAKVKERFADSEQWEEKFKDGVFKANKPKKCIQYIPHMKDLERAVQGEEDCLVLNIYTTNLDENAKYDVIVFIHGGAFIFGAGHAQSPEYLLKYNKKVVFVSINYRLGPFGFLSTGDDIVPGNMGLKDQVMALQWVKKHIRHFGGDPDKVMLAGMSAGAVSVHLHYLAPMSRHLFTKGISMSGVALSPLIKTKDVEQTAKYMGSLVDCGSGDRDMTREDVQKMIKCLKEKPARELVEKIVKDEIPWKTFNAYLPFGPVVDLWSPNPFLYEHPYFTLTEKRVKDAPWVASATTAEGLEPGGYFIDRKDHLYDLNSHWDEILPYLLMYEHCGNKEKFHSVAQEISQHYMMGHPVNKANRNAAIKMIGDRLFMTSIENSVRLHAKASPSNVYFYMFGYRGAKSYSEILSKSNADLGASHVDDMTYILKMNKFEPIETGDEVMVKRMVGVWESFMESGKPKMLGLEKEWPPVAKNIVIKGKLDHVLIMDRDSITATSTNDLSDRRFWERLPLQELHVSGNRKIPNYIRRLRRKRRRFSVFERVHSKIRKLFGKSDSNVVGYSLSSYKK